MNPYTKKIEQLSTDWHKIDNKLKFLQRTYGRKEALGMELYNRLLDQRWELDAQEMDLELQSKIYELNANFDPSIEIRYEDEQYISAENLLKRLVYLSKADAEFQAKWKNLPEDEAEELWRDEGLHISYEAIGTWDLLKNHYGIEVIHLS